MGLGDKLAAMVSKASVQNDQNGRTAQNLGVSSKGVDARRDELAESAAKAADLLKEEGH